MVDIHVHNEGTVFNGGQRVGRKKSNQSKFGMECNKSQCTGLQQENANVCASSLINCKLRCDLEPLDIPRDATAVSASPTIFVHSSLALEKSLLDFPVNVYILFGKPCSN